MKNHCILCEEISCKATDCKKVRNINKRKIIVASKKLCFNCLCESHRVIECKSKGRCCNSNGKNRYATNKLNSNHLWLKTTKSNAAVGTRRNLSCHSYSSRWNKITSSFGHRSWKFLYFIGIC